MEDDKIKYSDIIQPDDSIEKLIGQLEEFTKQYSTMTNAIRAGADRIVHAVRSASGATSEGRKSIDEAAMATSRLERAQRELRIAMSDTGKQIAWLKAQTLDTNKATVEQQRYIRTAITSYDRLKADLKETVELYKSLSAAERADSEMGQKLLASILGLKREIAALDAQMKPHIQTLSALEKAKQKLAFIQSEEGKQLLDIQAQIRAEIASRKEQKEAVSEVEKARRRLAQARSDENRQIKLYSLQTAEANQVAKLQAQIANSAKGSYNQLSAQYSLNKLKLNAMSAEQRNATETGKALEQETLQLYLQMQKLQEATGNYRLSVGHYQRAFSGLGFSVSQVVRELPSLAVSANTFFLAISNNIPLVIDEIVKLRMQNKLLQAEGKATISIAKSIGTAFFSWNTALVVVLSVLSIFGKDLIDWVKKLFGAEEALRSAEEALGDFGTELKSAGSSYGANLVTLQKLQKEWSRLTNNFERTEWLRKNKEEFNKLGVEISNVKDAETLLVRQSDAFIMALKLRAQATAAQSLATNKYSEALVESAAIEDLNFQIRFFEGLLQKYRANPNLSPYKYDKIPDMLSDLRDDLSEREGRLANITREAERYFELAMSSEDEAAALLKKLGLTPAGNNGGADASGRDASDAVYRMALAVRKKYEKSITALERNEYAKRRQEAQAEADARIRELEETYRKNEEYLSDESDKYKDLSEEERAIVEKAQLEIRETIVNIREQLNYDLGRLNREEALSELQIIQETINKRLEYVQAGTEEELRLRLRLLEVEEQIALAKNGLLPVEQQQLESDITGGFARKRAKTTGSFELESFDQQQALEEAKFNEVKRGEREQSRFRLQQEKERWEKQIALAEAGGLDWTQTQIDAAKSTVIGISRELDELDDFIANMGKKGLGATLLESLGFDDDAIDALSEATSIVLENIQAILDAEVEAAEAAVEAAEARVAAAQSAYDAEIEARNNGYANNVASAQKDLQLEKKRQRDKQKLLEEAQRRQEAINTITQASSLVTASANLWSSLSPIPIIGPALAIAAIGTMWTSFAAAKIRAKQITASASEEYGEGGLEFLEGGSHASGNDIDLGVANKNKKRMRAEGGEAMAIINRKSTRRYRRVLPDIVDSLNRGVFEDKFMRAFDTPQSSLAVINNTTDLTRIEDDVRAIKKQNETRYISLPDGCVLVTHKNVKRIIRNS